MAAGYDPEISQHDESVPLDVETMWANLLLADEMSEDCIALAEAMAEGPSPSSSPNAARCAQGG
jgi:hypothetical protein